MRNDGVRNSHRSLHICLAAMVWASHARAVRILALPGSSIVSLAGLSTCSSPSFACGKLRNSRTYLGAARHNRFQRLHRSCFQSPRQQSCLGPLWHFRIGPCLLSDLLRPSPVGDCLLGAQHYQLFLVRRLTHSTPILAGVAILDRCRLNSN